MSVDAATYAKLSADGGIPIGMVYQTVLPIAGRDILCNGTNVARSAYPGLSSLPSPPSGLVFTSQTNAAAVALAGQPIKGVYNGNTLGVITTSTNGSATLRRQASGGTWSSPNLGFNSNVHDIIYNNGVWYIAGGMGVLISTDDLLTFTRVVTPPNGNYTFTGLVANTDTNVVSVYMIYGVDYGTYISPYSANPVRVKSSSNNGVTWSADSAELAALTANGGYGYSYNRIYPRKVRFYYSQGYYYFSWQLDLLDTGYNYWSTSRSFNKATSAEGTNLTGAIQSPPGNLIGGDTDPNTGNLHVGFINNGDGRIIRYMFKNGVQETVRYSTNTVFPSGFANVADFDTISGSLVIHNDAILVGGANFYNTGRDLASNITSGTTSTNTFPTVSTSGISVAVYLPVFGPTGFILLSNQGNHAIEDYANLYAPFVSIPSIPMNNGVNSYVRAR